MAMPKIHPHADARYRVISLPGGSFGVEVSIPDSFPTTVSEFATEADAEAWIVTHKRRVETDKPGSGWFRKPGSRANPPAAK